MDNEQFKFGKFFLVIHNKSQPRLKALHVTAVIISWIRASLSFKPSECFVVTPPCTSRTLFDLVYIFRKCFFLLGPILTFGFKSFATWGIRWAGFFYQLHDSNHLFWVEICFSFCCCFCQYVGWCFIDVLYTSERRTMNGNGTARNDFTFYSTELLNWLSFLQQNSCTHTDKELKQDEKWPWPKLSSCYIEILWCCFLRSWNASGIARDLCKVPQSPGISLSPLYFHFSQSRHFLALSREDEATRFFTNN